MIKIQKEDFNSEEEINKIKDLHANVGAITSFTGYVRNQNNNKKVKSINLDVYEEMAYNKLKKGLDLLAKGKAIDYEGATAVKFTDVGEHVGNFIEKEIKGGKFKNKKQR